MSHVTKYGCRRWQVMVEKHPLFYDLEPSEFVHQYKGKVYRLEGVAANARLLLSSTLLGLVRAM